MNLIIRDFPDALADQLKQKTSSATLSKAVLTVVKDHHCLMMQNEDLTLEVDRLQAEVNRLRSVIEGAREAAVQLFERTSQTELRA